MNTLTTEQKVELVRAGAYDMEVFIAEHSKMVWSVLNKYKIGKLLSLQDEEDLYSMGLGGIFYAIRDYDASRGVKFSTFAWRYILTEIQRHYRDIQPHNYHGKTALRLSFSEYDVLEGVVETFDRYQIDLNEIDLTPRQKEWFLAYLEYENFSKVAEIYGVSKQAIRESVRQTQAKLRARYY